MTSQDVIVLTDDPQLQGELQTAAAALGEQQPRLRFAADRRALFEAVRSRPPELVLAPFGEAPREIATLAKELASLAPPIPVAAIFRPNGFQEGVSESTLLIEALRAGVRDFLRRPLSTAELRQLLLSIRQGQTRGSSSPLRTSGRVVSFISNKGGVGKSTLAVNSAVGLALRHPGRVLLIDASLQMGVCATLLDVHPSSTLADVAVERDRLDETMIRQMATPHPSGLHLLAAPKDAIEALEVDDSLVARVITLAKKQYDYIVIDTFPMFDRVVVAVLDLSDRAYIVVENVVPTLLGAVTLLDVLDRIGFPSERQRVVINRHQRITGDLPLADVAARLHRPIDLVLPYDKRVIAAANAGEPIAARTLRFARFSRGLAQLVRHIEALTSTQTPAAARDATHETNGHASRTSRDGAELAPVDGTAARFDPPPVQESPA